ncbi:lipase family protein [Streptomyces rectiverticillatus]|uniref:lipase family protein n=1 Tax=Streptomyces rectiverticillatus TaxID=173860 RepID=UPI001FEB635E|nr:lipase family protein [Streptomyces rectiverticillatus]
MSKSSTDPHIARPRTRRGRRWPRVLIALGVALPLAAGGCSDGSPEPPARGVGPGAGPGAAGGALPGIGITGRTYQVPQPLPPAAPGTLIAANDHGTDARIAGARRWTVLYHSRNAHDADVPVSGVVLVPPGPPPPGGRPVVAWAHGTTGVADTCAPSHAANLGYNAYAQEIGAFLKAGYAVTATDYPGLGTPGMHTYLVGADQGNAVVDSVTAAHRLLPDLAPTWFTVGHSQGGQASIFAANATKRAPDLRFGGAVAIAPASHLNVMLPGVIAAHNPGQLTFALYSLAGLNATDPSVDLPRLLGPSAMRTATQVFEECINDPHPSLIRTPSEQAIPLNSARLAALGRTMAAYGNPDHTAVRSPLLIIQGGNDLDVPAQWSAQVARNLRALGSPEITERTYPGSGHDDVLGRSSCDILDFLNKHGGRPTGACTPFRTLPG